MTRRIHGFLGGFLWAAALAAAGCGKTEFGTSPAGPTGPGPTPGDTTPPAEVTNLTATPGNTQVILAWTPSISPDIASYVVTVTPTAPAGPSMTPISVTPGSATGLTVTGLTNGTTYTFLVQGVDTSANTSVGVSVSATPTTVLDTTPPSAVTNLQAAPGGGQVTLTWGAATDNVGVTNYTVATRDLVNLVNLATVNVSPTVVPLGTTITGLTNGIAYRFTVRAQDAAGNTGPPTSVDATPGVPTTTVAYSSPGGAYRNAAPPSVTLSGLVNGNPSAGGVIFYTLDGSNPIVTNASTTTDGFTAVTAGRTTLVQNNGGGFVAIPLASTLVTTQFGPTTAGAGSTTTVFNGTFPTDGTIQSSDVVEITVSGGGPAVGETQTVINNGVSATSITVGAAFSAAPTATTQYRVRRTNRFVIIKAFYDPGGTIGATPPGSIATSNQAGVTQTVKYIFFPNVANTFVPYGGMIQPRQYHSATLMNNGSVAVFGGELGSGSSPPTPNIEEFFDRATEFFFRGTAPPFPAAATNGRQNHSAVLLDDTTGAVLLIGGQRVNSTGSINTDFLTGASAAERYNPVGNSLTSVGTGLNGRFLATANVLTARIGGTSPNRVLVSGGVGTAALVPATFTANSTSGASVVDHSVSTTYLQPGDILEVTTGSAAGETAVVVSVLIPPITALQSVAVAPSFSVAVAGATIRALRNVQQADAQLFDPTGSAWVDVPDFSPAGTTVTTGAALPDRRWAHASVLLQNGLVLLTGGHLEQNPSSLNDIERTMLVYDPSIGADGQFRYADASNGSPFRQNAARLRTAKFFHTATLLADGKVLVAGGMTDGTGFFTTTGFTNTQIQSTTDIFDPSNETTTTSGNLVKARAFHTATTLKNGKVLLTGGAIQTTTGGGIVITPDAELFDPATRTSSATGSMLTPRSGHVATLLPDGRVLITGGTGAPLPEIYDPILGVFVATAGTATANRDIGGAMTILNNGKLLVTGGEASNFIPAGGQSFGPGRITNLGEVYDPDISQFKLSVNAMGFTRRFHGSTLLDDGRVLITGGEGTAATAPTATPGPLATVEVYNPATDSFAATNAMSGGRVGHTATRLRTERIYNVGTATFNGTTTITGTGTLWTTDGVAAGDRIRLNTDGNYFEIAAVASNTSLTVRGPLPNGPIPGTVPTPITGAYTIRSEQPTTIGTATFPAPGLFIVTGTGTAWTRTVRIGDLIRPTVAGSPPTTFTVAAVNSDTQITLASAYTGVAGTGAYAVAPPSRVLVVGGGPSGSPLNTGEFWDPLTGNFTAVGNTMSQGRFGHSATVLANGFVVIVGGNSNFDRTAEIYDPAMNRFRQISLPVVGTAVTVAARNNHKTVLMSNGNVFICGGEVAQNVCEVFVADSDGNPNADADGDGIGGVDLTSGSFVQVTATMASGRVNHAIVRIPGATERVLIVGGKSGAANTGEIFTYNSATPASSTFGGALTLGRTGIEFPMAELLASASGAVVNGNVFILDGHTAQVFFSQ
ncbi:MAG: fibronectin type III domain-containing protein [Planctomycetales bacterium]|nr:fibronectin type III domain-containing protein [Planctomycetales bacterium]